MLQTVKPDAEHMRGWLKDQGLFELMIKAIKGDVINNERLSLRQRTSLALKLSDKVLPNLKSVEQKTSETIDVNIRYKATQELILNALDQ